MPRKAPIASLAGYEQVRGLSFSQVFSGALAYGTPLGMPYPPIPQITPKIQVIYQRFWGAAIDGVRIGRKFRGL